MVGDHLLDGADVERIARGQVLRFPRGVQFGKDAPHARCLAGAGLTFDNDRLVRVPHIQEDFIVVRRMHESELGQALGTKNLL
jgi:hypothetical protein